MDHPRQAPEALGGGNPRPGAPGPVPSPCPLEAGPGPRSLPPGFPAGPHPPLRQLHLFQLAHPPPLPLGAGRQRPEPPGRPPRGKGRKGGEKGAHWSRAARRCGRASVCSRGMAGGAPSRVADRCLPGPCGIVLVGRPLPARVPPPPPRPSLSWDNSNRFAQSESSCPVAWLSRLETSVCPRSQSLCSPPG